MTIGEGFQGKAGQSLINTMDTADVVDAIGLRGDQIRPAIGISEDEPESKAWRDVTGTGHLYIRGALQSLERMTKDEHDAEAAGTAEATINFAAKSPDGFYGSTAGQSAKLAQKILEAEKNGEIDLSQIITQTDIQTLLAGLNDANDIIAFMASEENAPDDIQTYAAAFDKVSQHYNAYGVYLNQRLDSDMINTPEDLS